MKTRSRILLSIALIVTMAIPLSCLAYTDVPANHWAKQKIGELEVQGVFSEFEGGHFYPNQAITRQDFFVMTIKGIYGAQTENAALPFADSDKVPQNLLPYLTKAYTEGVMAGTKTKQGLYINGSNPITRQEAATVIARLLKISSKEELEYNDNAQIAAYAAEGISGLKETGIIKGYADNTFKPKNSITRAESASVIYETLERNKLAKNQVSTYAGSGNMGELNGNAEAAEFYLPTGVAPDSKGNVFVMDNSNNLIRMISGDKKVSTLAGKVEGRDEYGFALGAFSDGDNKGTYFNSPTFGRVNGQGDVVISDSENHMIRMVGGSKTVTIAGNKQEGYANGKSDAARFNNPSGIAMDKIGNIYVADTKNHCIRKIDTKGEVSLLAGIPEKQGYSDGRANAAMFNEPMGIAVADDGTVFVSDTGNQRIREIDKTGQVTTLAGGGSDILEETDYIDGDYLDAKGSAARFNFPMGIDIVDDKYIVVADSKNHVIRLVDMEGNVRTIAGKPDIGAKNGTAFETTFNSPTDVAYGGKKIYIADRQNNSIRVMNFDSEVINK